MYQLNSTAAAMIDLLISLAAGLGILRVVFSSILSIVDPIEAVYIVKMYTQHNATLWMTGCRYIPSSEYIIYFNKFVTV